MNCIVGVKAVGVKESSMRVRSRLEGTDASKLMPIPPPHPVPKTTELRSVGVSRCTPGGSLASRAQAAGK